MNEVLYDGFHRIENVKAVIKGKKVNREKLVIKSAVGALVLDEKNRMGLVSQFRPTVNEQIWEIPAGILDKPNLSKLETMLEELEEECAIYAADLVVSNEKPILEYYMMAGSSDAKMFIYEIRVREQVDKIVEDVDVDEVKWFTMEQVQEMIALGKICDSKTILAYHLWTKMV